MRGIVPGPTSGGRLRVGEDPEVTYVGPGSPVDRFERDLGLFRQYQVDELRYVVGGAWELSRLAAAIGGREREQFVFRGVRFRAYVTRISRPSLNSPIFVTILPDGLCYRPEVEEIVEVKDEEFDHG